MTNEDNIEKGIALARAVHEKRLPGSRRRGGVLPLVVNAETYEAYAREWARLEKAAKRKSVKKK